MTMLYLFPINVWSRLYLSVDLCEIDVTSGAQVLADSYLLVLHFASSGTIRPFPGGSCCSRWSRPGDCCLAGSFLLDWVPYFLWCDHSCPFLAKGSSFHLFPQFASNLGSRLCSCSSSLRSRGCLIQSCSTARPLFPLRYQVRYRIGCCWFSSWVWPRRRITWSLPEFGSVLFELYLSYEFAVMLWSWFSCTILGRQNSGLGFSAVAWQPSSWLHGPSSIATLPSRCLRDRGSAVTLVVPAASCFVTAPLSWSFTPRTVGASTCYCWFSQSDVTYPWTRSFDCSRFPRVTKLDVEVVDGLAEWALAQSRHQSCHAFASSDSWQHWRNSAGC